MTIALINIKFLKKEQIDALNSSFIQGAIERRAIFVVCGDLQVKTYGERIRICEKMNREEDQMEISFHQMQEQQ